jgi:sulfate adenylyltransferase subunit 2
VTLRDGMWIAITEVTPARAGDVVEVHSVRYRTVGDMSCTAAILSAASTVHDVITEGRAESADRARRNTGRRPAV